MTINDQDGLGAGDKEAIIQMARLIESVIEKRRLDREHHRDETEKYLIYLSQGFDKISPYERRNAGINDQQWGVAKMRFFDALGIKPVDEEKQ